MASTGQNAHQPRGSAHANLVRQLVGRAEGEGEEAGDWAWPLISGANSCSKRAFVCSFVRKPDGEEERVSEEPREGDTSRRKSRVESLEGWTGGRST